MHPPQSAIVFPTVAVEVNQMTILLLEFALPICFPVPMKEASQKRQTVSNQPSIAMKQSAFKMLLGPMLERAAESPTLSPVAPELSIQEPPNMDQVASIQPQPLVLIALIRAEGTQMGILLLEFNLPTWFPAPNLPQTISIQPLVAMELVFKMSLVTMALVRAAVLFHTQEAPNMYPAASIQPLVPIAPIRAEGTQMGILLLEFNLPTWFPVPMKEASPNKHLMLSNQPSVVMELVFKMSLVTMAQVRAAVLLYMYPVAPELPLQEAPNIYPAASIQHLVPIVPIRAEDIQTGIPLLEFNLPTWFPAPNLPQTISSIHSTPLVTMAQVRAAVLLYMYPVAPELPLQEAPNIAASIQRSYSTDQSRRHPNGYSAAGVQFTNVVPSTQSASNYIHPTPGSYGAGVQNVPGHYGTSEGSSTIVHVSSGSRTPPTGNTQHIPSSIHSTPSSYSTDQSRRHPNGYSAAGVQFTNVVPSTQSASNYIHPTPGSYGAGVQNVPGHYGTSEGSSTIVHVSSGSRTPPTGNTQHDTQQHPFNLNHEFL